MRSSFNSFGYSTIAVFALTLTPRLLAENTLKEAGNNIRTAIYDITDKTSANLQFSAGETGLTDGQKAEIKSMIEATARDHKVRQVIVAAYGDKDYPRAADKTLTGKQQDLAEKRGKAVADVLRNQTQAGDVSVYNMAEKANALEKLFVTKDAQVKREAADKTADPGSDATFHQNVGKHLSQVGGPGKVIVIVRAG